jgi:hypothetical protein
MLLLAYTFEYFCPPNLSVTISHMPRLWDINGKGQRGYMEEMITLAPLQIQSIHLKGYGKHHNLRTLLSVLCEFFVRYSKFWTQMYLIIYIL